MRIGLREPGQDVPGVACTPRSSPQAVPQTNRPWAKRVHERRPFRFGIAKQQPGTGCGPLHMMLKGDSASARRSTAAFTAEELSAANARDGSFSGKARAFCEDVRGAGWSQLASRRIDTVTATAEGGTSARSRWDTDGRG